MVSRSVTRIVPIATYSGSSGSIAYNKPAATGAKVSATRTPVSRKLNPWLSMYGGIQRLKREDIGVHTASMPPRNKNAAIIIHECFPEVPMGDKSNSRSDEMAASCTNSKEMRRSGRILLSITVSNIIPVDEMAPRVPIVVREL